MTKTFVDRATLVRMHQVLRLPPRVLLRRLVEEAAAQVERSTAPRRGRRFDEAALLRAVGEPTVDSAWEAAGARPYALPTVPIDPHKLELLAPGEPSRIRRAAEAASARRVDLLGSGPIELGDEIDWHVDFKSGFRWQPGVATRDYADLERGNDVKVPWELSRLQWALPLGQAYLLDADDRHAADARRLIEHWAASNPYGASVNWVIAMEAAMRVFSWTWLFHALSAAPSWRDSSFRSLFLRQLYLHVDFVERRLERGAVNGNHAAADAAALVVGGLFFGDGGRRWADRGWEILLEEIPLQVFDDGVDHEASVPYHRLVFELFFLALRAREAAGLRVPDSICARVARMADFTVAYTRPDGTGPVWGDADDGRALAFGGQGLNDHRYIATLAGVAWRSGTTVIEPAAVPEAVWWVGIDAINAAALAPSEAAERLAFHDGGFFVLRSDRAHVFIDCGPVGLRGRGGHGHNDCLSFELWVEGAPLISDSGSYVYTPSYELRNAFRSTAAHNTPIVDGEEQNRLLAPKLIWALHPEAEGDLRELTDDGAVARFVGRHLGYHRLADPVTVERTIELDRQSSRLFVIDSFDAIAPHNVAVPFHLAPETTAQRFGDRWLLIRGTETFELRVWQDSEWLSCVEDGWYAPSYGVRIPRQVVNFRRYGLVRPLVVEIDLVARETDARSPEPAALLHKRSGGSR